MARYFHLRLIVLAVAAGWLALSAPTSGTSASGHSEYEVKAAYLYNFGRFVNWPHNAAPSPANEFVICVLGHDPFGPVLDGIISGEKIKEKNVVARRIAKVDDAAGCRVLYVSPSESRQLKEILKTLLKQSVLTVSDIPQFVKSGGMVQFVLLDRRVRFEINVAAARQAGLNLSSELLKVAADVSEGPGPGD